MLVLLNMITELSNFRKKKKNKKEPLYMTKELSNVILELHNMIIKPSNVRKKIREPPNVRKELSNVMLELHNVMIEPSNMRKNNNRTIKCEKRTVICDVRIT